MEEMGNESEFDELEKLIGSCNGISVEDFLSNGNLEGGNAIINKLQQPPMYQIPNGESNRLCEQSLVSDLENLSLSAEEAEQTWKSWRNLDSVLEDQFASHWNKQLLNKNAYGITVTAPSSRSSSHISNGSLDPHTTRLDPRNSHSLRPVPEVYKKWQVGHCQPFETSFPDMPFNHEVPNLDTPVPNFQLPAMSHHQESWQSGRSPVQYIHPRHVSRRQIDRNCTQEEQFYRMHGQYSYLHHLHNQQLGCFNPARPGDSIISRASFSNNKQGHFEVPVSHQLDQSTHEPFWKKLAVHSGTNQSSPVLTQYLGTMQGMEKNRSPNFPRKILTRTHGLNSVDGTMFLSVDADKSLNFVNQNRVVCSNCHARQNNLSSSIECFCHNNFRSSALFPDSTNVKILPQKYNSIDEVTGMIYLMAKDQHGCRFLQRKFVEGTLKDIEKIFNEIIDHVVELMTDPFGNYLVQKMLEVCDEDWQMQILLKITRNHGELIRISCDMHGTRAIQKVIETLKTPEQCSMIVSSLKPGIITLMKNTNGNHVAQHCVVYMKPDYSEFVFEAATNCCVELAMDRHGCCVLQKCLGCPEGRQRDSLISEIALNALVISQDQYGNYVVQFILELQLPWATLNILKQLEGNHGDLSMQKYGSNVVEKCLQYAWEGHRAKIVDELISDPRLNQIMQNPYGNYAIQTTLRQSEGPLRAKVINTVRLHTLMLRTSPYGRKVLAVLGKLTTGNDG